jgi:hypothetical protein
LLINTHKGGDIDDKETDDAEEAVTYEGFKQRGDDLFTFLSIALGK